MDNAYGGGRCWLVGGVRWSSGRLGGAACRGGRQSVAGVVGPRLGVPTAQHQQTHRQRIAQHVPASPEHTPDPRRRGRPYPGAALPLSLPLTKLRQARRLFLTAGPFRLPLRRRPVYFRLATRLQHPHRRPGHRPPPPRLLPPPHQPSAPTSPPRPPPATAAATVDSRGSPSAAASSLPL